MRRKTHPNNGRFAIVSITPWSITSPYSGTASAPRVPKKNVKTAKADFLPSLSGNISQRVVNRPNSARGTIISGDNITTSESKTSYNGSYGIDANWTVYNGSKRVNTVKQQKLNNRIAELNVDEKTKNSIEESIYPTVCNRSSTRPKLSK